MTNLKLVLRTYSALRQMSPDDIALLETLRALNDGDRELIVETLQGRATTKKAGKKSSTSKSSQLSTKSPRASGIHAQLNRNRQQQRETTKDGDNDEGGLCLAGIDSSGMTCGEPADNNVHHLNSHPDYHPFVADVRAAPTPSPANGGAGSVEEEIDQAVESARV